MTAFWVHHLWQRPHAAARVMAESYRPVVAKLYDTTIDIVSLFLRWRIDREED